MTDEQEQAGTTVGALFERLPDRIFMPLASPSRHHYWDLLLHLYDCLFCAYSADTPDEVEHGEVTHRIEQFLKHCPEWVGNPDDDLKVRNYSLNIRANAMLKQLVQAGWLQDRRVALRHLVDMSPEIQSFLEHLRAYAEDGPSTIGGEVQKIYATLREVEHDPVTNAPSLHAVAKDARDLVRTLANTRKLIREQQQIIRELEDPREVVNAFFSYITNIYITDYKELSTDNHPLRLRLDILDIVRRLQFSDTQRARLAEGYRQARIGGQQPERQLERDIDRFLQFEYIDRHLDRLNEAITSLNHQGLAYFEYLSTYDHDNITGHIDTVVERLRQLPDNIELASALPSDEMLYYARLKDYRKMRPARRRTPCRKRELTPEELAKHELRCIMAQNRDVSPQALSNCLNRYMGEQTAMSNADMDITQIHELTTMLTLPLYALATEYQQRHGSWEIPGFRISMDTTEWVDNNYMRTPTIHIERTEADHGAQLADARTA